MIRWMQKKFWQSVVIGLVSLFSFYMYAHIVEKVFLIDLPLVKAITVTHSPRTVSAVGEFKFPKEGREKYGFYGRPYTVRVPRLGLVLSLQEAQPEGEGWRVSDGAVSYLVYSPSEAGRIGNIAIFGADHSFLLDSIKQVVEGEQVVLETNEWVYSFRVIRKIALTDAQQYVPSLSNTSLTIIKPVDGATIVVETQFLNVQEKTQ